MKLRRTGGLVVAGLSVTGVSVAVATAALAKRRARQRRIPATVAGTNLEMPDDLAHHVVATDDGAKIHLVERGTGPPILLVHGMTLTSDVWAYQLRDLAASNRVIAMDQRGHGSSTTGSDGFDVGRLGGDIHQVLEELELRDAIVVGHSLGGMAVISMATSRQMSARVSGLVLAATTSGPVNKLQALTALTARIERRWERLGDAPDPWIQRIGANSAGVRLAFGRHPSSLHMELTRAMFEAIPDRTLHDLLRAVANFDVSSRLSEVDVPALVVVGSLDRLTPPGLSRRMVSVLPDAELVVLKGCGHMVMLERRQAMSDAIWRFASRARPSLADSQRVNPV